MLRRDDMQERAAAVVQSENMQGHDDLCHMHQMIAYLHAPRVYTEPVLRNMQCPTATIMYKVTALQACKQAEEQSHPPSRMQGCM
jgi:hypothetical protein